MAVNPFKLERYFAEYEFNARYLLSASDCESLPMSDLLQMADNECIDLWNHLQLGYTESAGHPLLRQEIARLYPNVEYDQVMLAVPEEAIFIVMHSLLRPGDQVIVISPSYQSLYELALSIGCQVKFWKVQPQGQGWDLDLEFLEENISSKTRMLVVNFPHNPTGYLPSLSDYNKIVNLAEKNRVYLFSDEMYRLLEYDHNHRLPPASTLYEKAISLSGLSKAFALPGLRLGWISCQDEDVINQCQAYKDYTTICGSAPSEILGIIALREQKKILARNLKIISESIQFAQDFFTRFDKWLTWMKPHAGSVAFPRWNGKIPMKVLCQQLLEEKGVMVVPGDIFDYAGSHFRVGLGRKNFPEALEQVGNYLQEH